MVKKFYTHIAINREHPVAVLMGVEDKFSVGYLKAKGHNWDSLKSWFRFRNSGSCVTELLAE